MSEIRVTHIVTYTCLHIRIFEEEFCPKVGEVLWCCKCTADVTVKSAPAEYRIRCRACHYSKACGRGKVDAEMAMVRHRKGRPEHIVDMFDGKVIVRTFGDNTVIQDSLIA